jgi:hypothetical protein
MISIQSTLTIFPTWIAERCLNKSFLENYMKQNSGVILNVTEYILESSVGSDKLDKRRLDNCANLLIINNYQ